MPSVVESLNQLLSRERGEVEAVEELMHQLQSTDPDIAAGARDALDTAEWSCHGLYHRIHHLGGTPTLDVEDTALRLAEEPDVKAKLQFLCSTQEDDLKLIKSILDGGYVDKHTRALLEDLSRAHEETANWCRRVLEEWKVSL